MAEGWRWAGAVRSLGPVSSSVAECQQTERRVCAPCQNQFAILDILGVPIIQKPLAHFASLSDLVLCDRL